MVLGNEHAGVSPEAIAGADLQCSIPMDGFVDSFNISVAAAIIMHYAKLQRVSTSFHCSQVEYRHRQSNLENTCFRNRLLVKFTRESHAPPNASGIGALLIVEACASNECNGCHWLYFCGRSFAGRLSASGAP